MTLPTIDVVTFAAYALAAAGVSWLAAGWRRIALFVGTVALGGSVGAAWLLAPEASIPVADRALAYGPYLRLWLVAAAASLAGVHLIAVAAGDRRGAAPSSLAALAATATALALDHPLAALVLLGGTTAFAVTADSIGPLLRATAVTLLLAVVGAMASVAVVTPGHPAFNAGGVASAALLLAATAVAVRAGGLPVGTPHRSLAALVPHPAAAIGSAWISAAMLLMLIAAAAASVAPGLPTGAAGDMIRIGTLGGLLIAGSITVVARDVRVLLGATVVVNASLVLAALVPDALRQPAVGPYAVAAWLPQFGVLATWAVAWLIALRATEAGTAISTVRGWARRRPMLAIALVVGGALSYGWPGTLPWDSRGALLDLGFGAARGPLRDAAAVLAWLPAFGVVRMLLAGVRHGRSTSGRAMVDATGARTAVRTAISGPNVAAVLVLLLALAPVLLAPAFGDLPGAAVSAPGVLDRRP